MLSSFCSQKILENTLVNVHQGIDSAELLCIINIADNLFFYVAADASFLFIDAQSYV